ncbi:MAG: hypothetical protein JNJ94_09465 [Chlorobi bacterium]|nr:hypothetical protein [Chlorobiota bacterium]
MLYSGKLAQIPPMRSGRVSYQMASGVRGGVMEIFRRSLAPLHTSTKLSMSGGQHSRWTQGG